MLDIIMHNSSIREVNSINTALKYLLLKKIDKKLSKEKTLFNCSGKY